MADTIKCISKINLSNEKYQVRHVDAADLPITEAELVALFPAGPIETSQTPETHEEVND